MFFRILFAGWGIVASVLVCLNAFTSGYGEGINIFLDGFLQARNWHFREESLTFETSKGSAEEVEPFTQYKYPSMSNTRGGFKPKWGGLKLKLNEGEFTDSQIIVILGESGTGKTTFIPMLFVNILFI